MGEQGQGRGAGADWKRRSHRGPAEKWDSIILGAKHPSAVAGGVGDHGGGVLEMEVLEVQLLQVGEAVGGRGEGEQGRGRRAGG